MTCTQAIKENKPFWDWLNGQIEELEARLGQRPVNDNQRLLQIVTAETVACELHLHDLVAVRQMSQRVRQSYERAVRELGPNWGETI